MYNIMKKIEEEYKNSDILNSFKFNVDFSDYVSFRTSGVVSALFEPKSVEELIEVLKFLQNQGIDFFVVGKGSNLFITPKGYNGVAIRLSKAFSNVSFDFKGDKSCLVTCGASASLSSVGHKSFEQSLTGMESLSLIPGTIGGAVFMNAGAYGIEFKDIVTKVKALSLIDYSLLEIGACDCSFGYRDSIFMEKPYIILGCELLLHEDNQELILAKHKEFKDKRNASQPLDKPSAGSTFKRPEGDFAGRLIEVSGLKGFSVGGAMVSPKHAGFVINNDNATPSDILTLIEEVKKKVLKETNVELCEEVRIIGEI